MAELTDHRFNELMIEHIELANGHLKEANAGQAGAALMHAAARFNAFVSSTQFVGGRVMLQSKEAHIDHYVNLYRQYLEGHYEEYAQNFAEYGRPNLGIPK